MNASFDSKPRPFLARRASGSVVRWWVAFERFSPRKFTVGLPGSSGWRLVGGRLVLRLEALQARRSLDERAVNREVLVREQAQRVRLADDLIEKLRCPHWLQQPAAVLAG